ncbi:MAG: hypothetical protein JEY99_10670 [Spirochaetales bacterium]|nr:hypothetical protein [Spirochaetales bacterium]
MKKVFPLFMLLLIAGIITMSAGWRVFLNIPSLVIVILLPTIASLVCFSSGEMIQAVKVAIKPENYEPNAVKKALVIQKATARNFDYTGALGFLIGVTAMFGNLNNEAYLTKGLALALIIIVYAVTIKFVFIIPAINALEKKMAEAG